MSKHKLQPVRGTHDLLPEEARKFQHIVVDYVERTYQKRAVA